MKGHIQIETLRKVLPGLLGDLDEATFEAIRPHLVWKWVELAGGDVLLREGDPSDALYLVTSGRLQASVVCPDGSAQAVGEIGRGESVGEMGMFTEEPRRATITALRDTTLARIDRVAFHQMLEASPALALKLNRVIIDRLQRRNESQKPTHNLTNIAVITASDGLAPAALLDGLIAELQRQKQTVLHLTSAIIDAAAKRPGAAQAGDDNPHGRRWLVSYLDRLEGLYDLVFYEADPEFTAWTQRCLRQADEILLLADATAPPELSSLEQACLVKSRPFKRVRQSLVLLHPAGAVPKPLTRKFLAARSRVRRHYHVRAGEAADISRLGRFLSNQAVGLVLAGGGARGLAHIGVFKALIEAGVPIDSIGGTSIGSVLGACLAVGYTWDFLYSENKTQFLSNPTSDFNFIPLVSLLAGRKLNRILERSFGALDIEDLWLPFFCVSSNYSRACEHVHSHGNLKWALMASMAIPGVFPPVVHGDDLLVDGGVFNNMPVDVMARTGVRTILAVDLRAQDKPRGPLNFDQVPSAWTLLMDRLRPKEKRRYALPSMLTTLMAANTLTSHQKMSSVAHDVDILFNPEVSAFGLLEWKSFDPLVDAGYRHAKEMLAKRWPLP